MPFQLHYTTSCKILLIWSLIILFCEVISFYLIPCIEEGHLMWHHDPMNKGQQHTIHKSETSASSSWVLLLADPQIADRVTYNVQNPWISPMFFFQEAYYAKRVTYGSIAGVLTPKWNLTEQYWLGDYLDGNLFLDNSEFQHYSEKLWHLHGGFNNSTIFQESHSLFHNLPKKSIFAFGNHDISILHSSWEQERIERMRHIFGGKEFFGFKDYTTEKTRVVWINSPHLSSSHIHDDYSEERAKEAWKFIDTMRETPLPSSTWKIVLLSHIPLYHEASHRCRSPLWIQRDNYIEYFIGLNFRNMLTPKETEYILDSIRPSLVISADHHYICRYEHLPSDRTTRRQEHVDVERLDEINHTQPLERRVEEHTIAAVGLLSGNFFPGLAVLNLSSLQVKHIFLPPVVVFLFLYGGFWSLCGFFVLVSAVKQAKSVVEFLKFCCEKTVILLIGGVGIYFASFLYWLWVWNGDHSGLL